MDIYAKQGFGCESCGRTLDAWSYANMETNCINCRKRILRIISNNLQGRKKHKLPVDE